MYSYFIPILFRCLLRSEDTVAGITKTGTDVSMVVETAVKMSNVDLDIRMILAKSLKAFRSSNDTHELNVLTAMLLDEVNCFRAGTAGCKHRIQDNDGSLVNRLRKLAVIFVGFVGFWIAV